MKVVVGNNQKTLIVRILAYVYHILGGNMEKHMLYELVDKKDRTYRFSSADQYDHPFYIAHPFQVHVVPFQGGEIRVTADILDEDRLYPYIARDVFEKVFHLVMETDGEGVIDLFLKEVVDYHFTRHPEIDTSCVYVYQYNESAELWEKFNEVPRRRIDTIYLPTNQSTRVLEDLQRFLSGDTKAMYEKFGIPYHKTYCLYGPPGTGKTSLVNALSSAVQKNICVFRVSPSTKDTDVANSLRWFPKNSILLLEDIDCILNGRDDVKGAITFSGMLNILDGFSSIDGLAIFITTNHFMELDTAIKRPGRIDYILEFGYINREQIYKMLDIFFPGESADYDAVYKELKGRRMTVSHMQKFLFSLYPAGGVLAALPSFVEEHLKYYQPSDNKMYA
jgi:hypothetical protein